MKLVCVKHGETNYNVLGLCNSFPTKKCFLTDKGISQAKDVAIKLKNNKFEIIYSSELYRTYQTANFINKYHELKILENENLDDRHTGFEDESYDSYKLKINKSKDEWNAKFNDAESFNEEKSRVYEFLNNLKKENYENVLIVTHDSIIQKIYGFINDLTNEEIINIEIPNCSIHDFEF
ncbi:MAG: phosphoglycerate mutase family protein [Candidatus Woesearchaeota archaeon]|jgi:broad specificity phosphatase PhoE|nr:phosphoglycerate mutase family protein [Candidatus Woesearchaeota archaeon]